MRGAAERLGIVLLNCEGPRIRRHELGRLAQAVSKGGGSSRKELGQLGWTALRGG